MAATSSGNWGDYKWITEALHKKGGYQICSAFSEREEAFLLRGDESDGTNEAGLKLILHSTTND
jgi:hypothetical protein